jgi:hypothetical protein
MQKAQELIQIVVLDRIYDSLDLILDPCIKFSQPILERIPFFLLFCYNNFLVLEDHEGHK